MDLSIFATPEAWISLVTLIFLEIVLGVDNLVFISITTNRLPAEKQHIGRKLGLAGALVMRIIFLCFASYLVHMTTPLFTIDLGPYSHGFSVRDLVLLIGGGYLIYKGIAELIDMLKLTEVKAAHCEEHKALHMITLPQAVGTIMVMDLVFSIDSVITAVGMADHLIIMIIAVMLAVILMMITLPQAVGTIMVMDLVFSIDSVITAVGMADHLIIMIIAVMLAVILMMIFIDPISNFINGHPEMKMLALTFIVAIGALLVIDSAGFHTGIELLHMPLEKLMVYFAMVFSIVLELIQMRYNANFLAWRKDRWKEDTQTQIENVRAEMLEQLEEAEKAIALELIQMRYNANFLAWRKDRWKEDTQTQIENVRAEMLEQLEEAEKAIAEDRAAGVTPREERIQPVIIGNNVYVMMPMAGEDAGSFKELMADSEQAGKVFSEPLELTAAEVTVEDAPGDDGDASTSAR